MSMALEDEIYQTLILIIFLYTSLFFVDFDERILKQQQEEEERKRQRRERKKEKKVSTINDKANTTLYIYTHSHMDVTPKWCVL